MQEIMAIFQIIKDDQGNPKDMIIIDVNQAYISSLNLPREKVIDQRASLIYGPEFVDNYFKLVQNNPEIGKGKKFETYFPPLDKYYLTTLFTVGDDLYVTLGIDITERKTLEKKLNDERDILDLKVQEKTKELLEIEKKLIKAQEIAQIGNWELNLKTNKLWFSDEIYHIFGYNLNSVDSEINFQKLEITYDILINKIIHPDDRDFLDNSFKDALKGKPYDIDHRIILPNGEERIIHEQAELICDGDENPVKMAGITQDITERKKAENLLKESEEKLSIIFQKANDMISLNLMNDDGLPGKFLEVNDVASERLGYTREELLNMSPSDIVAPEKRPEIPKNAAVLIEKCHNTFEIVHLTKTGERIQVEVNNHLIQYKGREVCLAISRDITERKKAEEAIKESEEKFREIFNKANDMITLAELNKNGLPGRYIEVNDVGIKRLGYSYDEFLNMEPQDIVADEKKKEIVKYAVDLWTKGHSTFEMIHVAKDGKRIPVEVSNHLFKMKGKNVALAIIRDIKERKKSENELNELLEKLSHSNEELERFAYITSHDLQEPLKALANFSQLLKQQYKGKFDEDGEELIDYIVDTSAQIQHMVHDLFEYSQISAEKEEFESVDLKKVFKTVLIDLNYLINKNNVKITMENLPTVIANNKQISMVFKNLITSAIKSQDGTKPSKIHISSIEDLKNGEYLISINLNRILVDLQYTEEIFSQFQYLTTHKLYEGSFVDLVTSKKIIEMYNGRIWVESKPNVGTTFYFSLPIKKD